MSGGMPNSPRGFEIREVDGRAAEIVERGEAITDLGNKMESAADTLQSIKENTFSGGAMAGDAIEALQETIGDCYKKLGEAADLYKPVGPVIETYGGVLETNKPPLDRSASTCQDLWSTYSSLPGDKDGSTEPEEGGGNPTPQETQAAQDDADDNQAKKEAYDAWETEAESFDTWRDAWKDGYDDAVSGITDGLSGSIEDGFWDDIGPAVDFLKTVVDIAAIIVAVVALVAGGWVIAAIAAGLALAALALTAAQWARGAASFTDVLWAAVGVVPFGKISTLAKFGALRKLATNADEMGKARTALKGDVFKTFKDLKPSTWADNADGAWKYKGFKELKGGFKSKGDVLQSYKDGLGREFAQGDFNAIKNIAKVEQGVRNTGNAMTHYGRAQTVMNNDNWGVVKDVPGLGSIPAIPKVPGINMPIGTVV